MNRRSKWVTQLARVGACSATLIACSSDCVVHPCPLPEAVRLSVSAADAPFGIVGLAVTVAGKVTGNALCDPGPVAICHVLGGFGTYQLSVSAPGYQTVQLQATVNESDTKCNVCGVGDRQDLAVVLRPTS